MAASEHSEPYTDGNMQMPLDLPILSSSLPSVGDCLQAGQAENASKAILPAPSNYGTISDKQSAHTSR